MTNSNIRIRKVMEQHEYQVLMSDCYTECIDYGVLISKEQADKDWFQALDRVVQYLLYNYFDIEVVKEVVE